MENRKQKIVHGVSEINSTAHEYSIKTIKIERW